MALVTSQRSGYFDEPGVFTSSTGNNSLPTIATSAAIGHTVCLRGSKTLSIGASISFTNAGTTSDFYPVAGLAVPDGAPSYLKLAGSNQVITFTSVGSMMPTSSVNGATGPTYIPVGLHG